MDKVRLGEVDYDVNDLDNETKSKISMVKFLSKQIAEKENMLAVLVKAKGAYIAELKLEVLSAKSGFDFIE